MEHVVFFGGERGEPTFRRASDLEEAVRIVESLRNEHGVDDVEVHALSPVPVSFRTYYRVEVGGGRFFPGVASQPSAQVSVEPPATADVDADARAEQPDEADFEAPARQPQPDAVPVAAARLTLLAPPAEPGHVVFPLTDEHVDEDDRAGRAEQAQGGSDDQVAPTVYEPVVPQVRSQPEAERSLGYFAT